MRTTRARWSCSPRRACYTLVRMPRNTISFTPPHGCVLKRPAVPLIGKTGTSLDVFKKWAGDERNMVIMPGYCVAGTVGAKVLAGQKQVRAVIRGKRETGNERFQRVGRPMDE